MIDLNNVPPVESVIEVVLTVKMRGQEHTIRSSIVLVDGRSIHDSVDLGIDAAHNAMIALTDDRTFPAEEEE